MRFLLMLLILVLAPTCVPHLSFLSLLSLVPACVPHLSFLSLLSFPNFVSLFLLHFYFNWASAVSSCCQLWNVHPPLSDAALYRCLQPYHLCLIRQWTITNSSSRVSSLAGIISGIFRHIVEGKITPCLSLWYLIIYFKGDWSECKISTALMKKI